nr:vancomycin resistance histidine kinase VanS [Clostridium aciditolerans]
MRNKRKRPDYIKLKRKIFFQMLLIVVASVFVALFLRSLCRGKIGELVVRFLERSFLLRYEDAFTIYQYTFRNNLDIFMMITIIIFFLIFFRFFLSWFTKYFNEMNDGVDALIRGENKAIEMSPEMDFMESKLNVLKQTLKIREQNAQQAEQRKNDLVMYLAHDIKTPLTSVIGYLSLLDEAPDMPTEQKVKYVRITLEKAYRLENLINEFFEITRYNFQTMTLERETIDLYYMLIQMTDEFYPLLEPHGKQAVIHADENMTIYGDPAKLARVFNNILKNAVAYSNDNSIIDISAEVQQNNVVISFRNTGKTIPKEKLSYIFEKFFRLDEARTTNTGGAGLGLAIAKEIVTLHGGTISAESSNGITVFTVTLPVKQNELEEA